MGDRGLSPVSVFLTPGSEHFRPDRPEGNKRGPTLKSDAINSAVPSQQKTIHTSPAWMETHSLKCRVLPSPEKKSRNCCLTWILINYWPDSIPSRFLKDYAEEITPAITLIFQASLQQGEVPQDWRQAYVTPLFKKGDRSSPAKNRSISMTSACSKVMEHILHSQVMKHLEAHGILSDQ